MKIQVSQKQKIHDIKVQIEKLLKIPTQFQEYYTGDKPFTGLMQVFEYTRDVQQYYRLHLIIKDSIKINICREKIVWKAFDEKTTF